MRYFFTRNVLALITNVCPVKISENTLYTFASIHTVDSKFEYNCGLHPKYYFSMKIKCRHYAFNLIFAVESWILLVTQKLEWVNFTQVKKRLLHGWMFEMKGTKVIWPGYLLTSLTCKRGSMSGGSLVLASTTAQCFRMHL